VICANCQTQNESGRKFCMECGAPLAAGCPNCGVPNPAAAKFCGECGTTLSAATGSVSAGPTVAAPRVGGSAERRLVTVLFADLVGFTTLAQDLDPEDTREFLTHYFDVTRTIVERYGGTVEKFIGDAVMAVWGTPTAHEDDAERAVRAALDIVGAVPSLAGQLEVQVRAGVLTGEAAVTVGATGQGMVAGDLVNTASRLQSVAPAGSVLVGEATYHAARESISFEQVGEQFLKGKTAPVPAWRATAVVALRRGSGRSDTLEPPFVGRDEDLRLLKELFHATDRERKARLVSVVGQAGIGKSRLAWEFEKYIDGVVGQVWWHSGRSPAYGEGISYWALAEMVRGRAGIAEADDAGLARSRLRDVLIEWVTDETERRWVEPRLAALLALEPMPPGSRDELFAAWRTFFERIAERGPTVLLFEDLQWADDGMIDFIEELLDRSRNQPIFVLTLARPELAERRQGWGANVRSFTAMGLEPLAPSQIGEMVRGMMPGIPEPAVAAIVGRAEGIPLYAVETVRMLIDRGDLRAISDGRYEMTGAIDRLAVPETLQALIASRLDALDDRERKLLQTAAVVGQSFSIGALAAVAADSPEAVQQALAGLVRREMLRVDVDPRSPERGQYQFVQGVVKEVAEHSLARADRRALHLAAARHYESLGDDELAGVLASHYVEAYHATPAGPEADALAAQARVSLRGAAERAATLHSHAQALSYIEQALAVTAEPLEQAALHERATQAALSAGRLDRAAGHAQEAESILRAHGDRLGVLRGITLQATVHLAQHAERPAMALLRPALEAVGDLDPNPEICHAQAELARALMLGSAYPESIEWCNRVLATPHLVSDEELVGVLITKGTALGSTPAQREAEVLLRGAIGTAERLGLIGAALRARNNLLGLLALIDLREANETIEQGFALAERFGQKGSALHFALLGYSSAFERGDWEAWRQETADFEPEGFYKAWRDQELARRAAFRAQDVMPEEVLSDADRVIGGSSSQAAASRGEFSAGFHVARGKWDLVMPQARIGWSHLDSAMPSIAWATVAGIGAAEPGWIDEAVAQFEGVWAGPYLAGIRGVAATGAALLDGRWADARTSYLSARHVLDEGGMRFWLAMLDLAVGTRGAGHFPEADEAAAAADAFFESVGARSFVERYRASLKTGHATASAPARSAATPSAVHERGG
jgi:class 3 adenylate cyclase/tetratricopeptide (TPR) repeat protein